ncbi:MAG: SpoIIE family protein phosphatase, partial [Bryobacteraceae bacterium]
YSDGIPDQLNAKGDEYGRGRLSKVVRSHCQMPAQQIVEAIFKDVKRFGASAAAFDDQTLLVVKVK